MISELCAATNLALTLLAGDDDWLRLRCRSNLSEARSNCGKSV
ncbi:MAG: hypothetical protein WKF84_16300 [Pyrinomonadaceae bacterium]